MKRFFIVFAKCLVLIIASNAVANALEVKNSDKKVNLDLQGIFADGYLEFPKVIDVSYSDKMNGKSVEVTYKISTVGQPDNFYLSQDQIKLMYLDFNPEKNKLEIKGNITYKAAHETVILATFESAVFNPGKNFRVWLIAFNSPIGKSDISGIKGKSLQYSKGEMNFSDKFPALFWINDDLTLTFEDKPSWPHKGKIKIKNKQ